MPTSTVTSPGTYYHRHIKPVYESRVQQSSSSDPDELIIISGYEPLDGIVLSSIPCTARPIAAESWLLATEYEHVDLRTGIVYSKPSYRCAPILTVWIKSSKSHRNEDENGIPTTPYYGMRFLGVPPHHVGALHGFGRKRIAREPTDKELGQLLAKSTIDRS